MYASGAVRVAVPATSANLGPGFDALGLALTLEDEVSARIGEAGVQVTVTGEGAGEVPSGPDHLIVRTMLRTFAELELPPPAGLELTCHNRIPHARGLGSSSAAIVAGILLARELAGRDQSTEEALRLAAEIEGHPDNVAPCLLGGFTIAWIGSGGARAVRLEPSSDLRPTVFIPETRGLTATARAALPTEVPHRDAAFNAARAALLVHALTADPALLLEATEDRLHQPYRAPGMPETAALLARLREQHVPACVSGAGPTVLAFAPPEDIDPPPGWCARSLSWSRTGARILSARHAGGDPVAAGPPS
jgi:homoserine kinase